MSLNKNQQNIINGITIAGLIIFAILWFVGYRQINMLNQNILTEQETRVALEDSIKGLNIRTIADQLFIVGNYDSASYYYQMYQNYDPELGNLFRQRMNLIENSEQSKLQRELSSKEMEYKLSFMRKKNNEFETKIAELEENYEKQNQELIIVRKEKLALRDSIIVIRASAKAKIESASDTLVFVSSSGNKVRYHGQVANNRANGIGSGFWSTGGYYHGEWKNNMRHGEGFYIWKEGHKYKGTFVDDIRDGYGVYHWPNGEYYEGNWKDNKRNGQGTLYNSEGFIKFSGFWEEDKPVNSSN
jgi:hypothetical protein